ncbi:hypothetical protein B472_04970 [Limnohabitans sp. Rim28]|nr:hypothetical protein B472_04970 [Limnohabitans sp. Rim28]
MQQYVGTKYLMNKYLVTVRVGGQLVKTAVFADSTIHAKLLCQYKYGMNSIAVSPVRVDEAEAEDDSTLLDSTIKPKPPATPAQARINSLKQGVERSREQLHAERERQRQQRETERKRKQQQQRF